MKNKSSKRNGSKRNGSKRNGSKRNGSKRSGSKKRIKSKGFKKERFKKERFKKERFKKELLKKGGGVKITGFTTQVKKETNKKLKTYYVTLNIKIKNERNEEEGMEIKFPFKQNESFLNVMNEFKSHFPLGDKLIIEIQEDIIEKIKELNKNNINLK